jgi:diguanylate cyclase (GGDEF)-like protein/PAS domain S-box-containing protein
MKFDDQMFQRILDSLHDGVYLVDRDRRITYWNRGAERLTGYAATEAVGHFCRDNLLVHIDETGQLLCLANCPLAATMDDAQPRAADVFLKHKNGERVPVSVRVAPLYGKDGEVIGGVETFSDNHTKVAIAEEVERLRALSLLDPLTQVGNRRLAEDQLAAFQQEAVRYGAPFGLLFLDVDHFKQINDRHGHDAGDALLRMLGRQLATSVRAFDRVCRWGGEEFLVLVKQVTNQPLRAVAEKLRVLVERSDIPFAGAPLSCTVSIGGTAYRDHESIDTAIERADQLMYRAKRSGRNQVYVE